MKYVFYRMTDAQEIAIMDDINAHHICLIFDIPGVEGDEHHADALANIGVPSNIYENEECENSFTILKDDYPTEQDLHNELRKYGFTFDPNWTP